MCDHCGCNEVPAIRELMAEHTALLDEAELIRAMARAGDGDAAVARLTHLVAHLRAHVRREELGVFAALRAGGEFADEVDELEDEHEDLDTALAALAPAAPGFAHRVDELFASLAAHIEREAVGVFPVSVVTLGKGGWDLVERAREAVPTFLRDPALAAAHRTVGESMIHFPKTMPTGVSVAEVEEVFTDKYVHMVLLTESGRLEGTLVREDLRGAPGHVPARPLAQLEGRTVSPLASAEHALRTMRSKGVRRFAVVEDGLLVGLLCLNRTGTRFCSDQDVHARAREAAERVC